MNWNEAFEEAARLEAETGEFYGVVNKAVYAGFYVTKYGEIRDPCIVEGGISNYIGHITKEDEMRDDWEVELFF